jgi:hypothetical protein
MIERLSLSRDLVDEVERRAVAEGMPPAEVASHLVRLALPKLVADIVGTESVSDVTSEQNDAPGVARGVCSTSPKIVAYASIAPRRPSGRPRRDGIA